MYTKLSVSPYFGESILHDHQKKKKIATNWNALFTRRDQGNPTARVTLVKPSKIVLVYKQNLTGLVTPSPGKTLNDLDNRTRLETNKTLSRVAELSLAER